MISIIKNSYPQMHSMALLFLFLGLTGSTLAKPIFDPFVQEFQVGTYNNPDELELSWGLPAGLLKPASIDTGWTNNGLQILDQTPSLSSPHLTMKLLFAMNDSTASASWIKWHRLRISQVINQGDKLDATGQYLWPERLTMFFFNAVQKDNFELALKTAHQILDRSKKSALLVRERFVWDLRIRLLEKILKTETVSHDYFFDSLLQLGSYDAGNAWAIWTAHRRLNGLPALPPTLDSMKDAKKLSGIRKNWLSSADIQKSSFPSDIKTGLGAKLLKKDELKKHLARYPQPPGNFTLQGWWMSGQRGSRRGETPFYENLGRREDLKSGWRMDVYRRASEVHLLNGRWAEGLVDLELSLQFVNLKSGTSGQRRRLRQWTEQALVLALAKDKTSTALKIFELGNSYFTGSDSELFMNETKHWHSEIGIVQTDSLASPPQPDDLIIAAGNLIASGLASIITPADKAETSQFLKSSATPLWQLWARWGLAGIQENSEAETISQYRDFLQSCLLTDNKKEQFNYVVKAVGLMLTDRLDQETLLRWTLDKDIHIRSRGRALTAVSPLSKLAKKKLQDPAALHALLGLALLADDMRGIVGVATPMAQTGLTKREKLCFLYPLPRAGAIHTALAQADNDPALILAVARNESLFEPSVRSWAGALGYLQIMPFHFPDKGARPGADNWSCAGVSIAKGDALLKENRRRYEGNPYKVLAAYNAGPGAVNRWQKQLGKTTRKDIYLAWIGYPETRHYVEKVLIDKIVYDWIIRESRLVN